MNDDQLRQPQDMNDTADAQDSSEGNGAQDMYRMDDMGNADNTVSSDIEAQSTNNDGQSDGEEATGEEATGEVADDAATMSSDAPAGESEQTSTGEDTSGMIEIIDMPVDAGTNSESAPGMAELSDSVDAPMDVAADMSAGDIAVEAPEAPQASGDETPDERPSRPPRPQYASDEAPSDEMVIHIARDPRMDDIASNASMEDLMKASERQYRPIKHGDVIEGTVMKVGRDEIMIDIGGKTEGVISSRESTSLTEEEREALQIGDTLLVSVVQPHNSEGQAVLSLDRARQEKAWRDLQRAFEAGETISAPVVGHNKGGILVNIEGIRGFVPSSQVSSLPPGEANKQAEMARLHNQSIPLKIIEINRHRNRLILSERQAMQEQRESMRARLLLELQSGQIRPGTVTSVCDFGAFVDIGGADGLIHLSELSWKRVSHPSEVLKVGDRVNVYVLSVDQHERKIALSLKRTQPEPWETITDQYQLGQLVKGTITQITTFGAFARLEDGIEGLIHVSELAEGRVAHPRNVVKEGEQLELKVIRIDPARKRIGLSLKRVNEDANRADEGAEGEAPEMGGAGDAGMEGQPPSMPQQSSEPESPRQEPRQQEQRPPRQAPQQRGQQGQRPPRQQPQPQQPLTSQSEDFEHLGAFAQALAAHTQQTSAGPEGEGGGQEAATSPSAPAEESDPGEVTGSLSGVNTSADMDATSAMEDAGDEAASDTGSGGDMAEQAGGADSLPGDKSDATATAPEMGAFGTEEGDSATDAATDSGDMPSEDAQDDAGDTSEDATAEADAPSGDESADTSAEAEISSSGESTDTSTESNIPLGDESADTSTEADIPSGGESADTDAGDGDEPQAMMPSAADASDAETGDTGSEEGTDVAAEETSTTDTDVATDSGDMPAEEPDASMPSSESMESADSTDTSSEEADTGEAGDDTDSPTDASAGDMDTSSTSDSADDADSGAPSGSEGEPSTADSEASDEGNEGKDEKDQG